MYTTDVLFNVTELQKKNNLDANGKCSRSMMTKLALASNKLSPKISTHFGKHLLI